MNKLHPQSCWTSLHILSPISSLVWNASHITSYSNWAYLWFFSVSTG